MRYILLICGDEPAYEAMQADDSFLANCHSWSDEMGRRGVLVGTGGLGPPSDATTLRVRDDQVLLSDGPFAETKEVIAGFSFIECADLDEALEVTAKHPVAKYGTIEIRPLLEA